jgi:hypothetical protein
MPYGSFYIKEHEVKSGLYSNQMGSGLAKSDVGSAVAGLSLVIDTLFYKFPLSGDLITGFIFLGLCTKDRILTVF